jgi:hypothetical protein
MEWRGAWTCVRGGDGKAKEKGGLEGREDRIGVALVNWRPRLVSSAEWGIESILVGGLVKKKKER